MYATKQTANRREALTLIELLVVIAIILAIAALAAAFTPRVNESTNLTRSVDQLEQWLLTAKMRAKRDNLATGLRFIPDPNPNHAGQFFQCQYIQQPDSLSGGMSVPIGTPGAYQYPPATGGFYTGGLCISATNGLVQFAGVDFSIGGTPLPTQWLVQAGDFLELRDGGVYLIGAVTSPTTFQLPTAIGQSLVLAAPTTNYRILRQPRILIGETPLELPFNYAVDMNLIPATIVPANATVPWSNVAAGASGFPEILFSPSGAVVGTNAGNGKLLLSVYDITMNPFDINRIGIVGVQTRTGFIGAFSAAPGAGTPGYDPFYYAEIGRESGL